MCLEKITKVHIFRAIADLRLGKAWSPPAVQAVLGNYSVLGKETAKKIPGAVLVEFDDLGHAPQIQESDRYHAALFQWLDSNS